MNISPKPFKLSARLKCLACMSLVCLSPASVNPAHAFLSGSLEENAIEKRLQPDAQVHVEYGAGGAAPTKTLSADAGKKRYEYTCKMCHETGVAGAPKMTDKAKWQPRVAEGLETLVKHAIQGYKAMPPKGGCMTCDDEEIRKTVEFMLSKVK